MGFGSKLIIFSALVLISSIVLQEYIPKEITKLLDYPFVNELLSTSRNFIKDTLHLLKGNNPSANKSNKKNERILTKEELKEHDGSDASKDLYLAFLGRVYDVSKGSKFYGPGGGYEFFSGRDGSRAFISGDFTEEGLTDDVTGLSSQDYIGLDDWAQFYEKDYKYVGKLVGRFYDDEGNPTSYHNLVLRWIYEAKAHKEEEDKEKQLFPPCNSEWTPESGSRLYCTNKSGGIERNWVGVPRKIFYPGENRERCACVRNFGPPSYDPARQQHANKGDLDHPNLKEYPGCLPDKDSCHLPKDDKS